ncbi:RNA pseudouridine synthase [Rhodoferax lacus]|uniref:Dual-specificity RNA pseudouridine synthase RluA n=1 Tax=Rhodoferax lacus TaxID=2184758 RepID=A0A3E1RC04_9BURK|nr:RluA family pseudouridine synthase [Rhodoferax lacus]RFO96751.1 RNA pseudouridine synthase [Rhodoferax lacus]
MLTEAQQLQVVYADAAIVVLNKPSGLLAVPGKTSDHCLSGMAQAQFPDALIVHRLDMSTSGLMVMARGIASQRLLNADFAERRVHKRYVALASGDCRESESHASDEWQTIELPIMVDWPRRPLRKIDLELGKPSSTRWRTLHYDSQRNATRLELEPLTGRTHQLRVHLQAIGHPIVGDALYAPPEIAAASPRLLLHASELAFAHPQTGARLSFQLADGFDAQA